MTLASKEHLMKKAALEKVLDSLPDGCYVFGGAVRDSLNGEEFKDIDLYFKDINAYNTFLNALFNHGYSTAFEREGQYVKRNLHEVRELSFRQKGSFSEVVCKIDCVVGNKRQGSHMRPEEWDADIHALAMDKNRQIKSLAGASDQELAEIIKKIRKHMYTALPGMTEFRKEKLTTKGYKEMPPLPNDAPSFFETFKNEVAPEVAYRVAANQLVKGTKQVALLGLQSKGGESDAVKTVTEIMNTEAGDVAVAAMLAALCMYTPSLKDNPKVKRLAKEFQIAGMATGVNALLDVVRELLLPGLLDALKKLPEIPEEASAQTRVASATPLFPETKVEDDFPVYEDLPKRAAAR